MKRILCIIALTSFLSPWTNAAQVIMSSTGDWGSAFQVSTQITNDDASAINGWTLEFDASFTIDQIWNAQIISHTGATYVIGSLAHTAEIGVGASTDFGFIASPGNSIIPTQFTFNGNHSGGGGTPPDNSNALPDDDWLTISGNTIVNQQGQAVWLTGANWFGFNTTERVFHGLWSANLDTTVKAMADRGINLIRVPFASELIYEWMNGVFVPHNINTHANPELIGKNSLEVFDAFLQSAKRYGVKVLLDAHSPHIDNMGHIYPLWTKGVVTEEVFYDTWVWLAARYKNDDTIIGFDLENEPHGKAHSDVLFAKWDDSNDANNWKRVAQEASKRILAVHPNVLILIEGIEVYPIDGVSWNSKDENDYHFNWWGGNLRGVKDHPIIVPGHQNQIMYSPHDYGPAVYQQAWFYPGFNKFTLIADVWDDNWLYIHTQNISPLLVGEWGGFLDGGDNETWMVALRDLMNDYKIHHTFWTLNPNSGDTGGLLNDDWSTWNEAKYNILRPVLWTSTNGEFVGLDHEVPLGANGISVKDHYANGGPEPIGL